MIHTLRGAGYVLKPAALTAGADAASGRRGRWSLRARLLVTQVVLLALVCAAIGVAHRVCAATLPDASARSTGWPKPGVGRSAMFEFGPPPFAAGHRARCAGPSRPPPGYPRRMIIRDDDGPGPAFLNAPGQAARTVGAVIAQGAPVDAGVDHRRRRASRDQCRRSATARRRSRRTAHPTTDRPRRAGPLPGDRRCMRAARRRRSSSGLPTSDVDDTLLWVLGHVLRGRRRRAGRRRRPRAS